MPASLQEIRPQSPLPDLFCPRLQGFSREHGSGTENGAERAENRVVRSGAWSGLNQPLHAPLQPNKNFIMYMYIVRTLLSGVQSTVLICTLLLFTNLLFTCLNTPNLLHRLITQPKAFITRPNLSRRHDAF